jgi:hypothetical protein
MHKAQLKILSVIIVLILTIGFISCESESKPVTNDEFLNQITELDEFKMEERRIDSLKETGMKVDLTISVVKDSFFPEDSAKNLSVAFVEEDLGFANSTLLIVKFDKDDKKIISVEKN